MTKTWLEWPWEAFKCCLTIPKRLINGINGLIYLVFQKKKSFWDDLTGLLYVLKYQKLQNWYSLFETINNLKMDFFWFFLGLSRFWIEILAWLFMRTATVHLKFLCFLNSRKLQKKEISIKHSGLIFLMTLTREAN